jgi:hypothetical protein
MQSILRITLLIILGIGIAACTADLRGPALTASVSPPVARDRLHRAAAVHGHAAWRDKHAVEIRFEDVWDSALATLMGLKPWDKGDIVRMRFLTGRYEGRVDFVSGPRAGEAWGLREGQYWTRSADGIDIGPEDGEAFPLRAFAYLFELPFRLTEADVIVDAGDARFEGRRYYRVLAAWGGVEPNEHDQYRVWIDAETGQIGLVDYTVREQAGFVQARTVFGDYRTIDGVLVPHILTVIDVGDSPADGFIHKVVVHDAGFGRFTAAALAPDAPIAGR